MLAHYVNHLGNTYPTLIMLHGFISDQSTFQKLEQKLQNKGFNILKIDLPGHGNDQSNDEVTWDMHYICHEIKVLIDYYNLKTVYLYGYSMGGRIALSFSIQYPKVLQGLILESASPGIKLQSEKEKRIMLDKERAEKIQNIGIKNFVEEWSKLPLFNSQKDLPNEEQNRIKKMRLAQNPKGLSKALIDYGTGAQPSYWNDLIKLDVPTCIVVGERDEKFINIGKKMNNTIKNSELHIINNAGHTIHVEQPSKFDTIIIEFILGGKL